MPKNPTPRFKADEKEALAAAERLVPPGHLAREVARLVSRVDVSAAEARSSALGQNGYGPRRLLGVWVYASLIGLHHGTKVHERMKTDAALRLLAGGHLVSRASLNAFRAAQGALFQAALEQTVRWGFEQGLVDAQALAVDSVRLRAHAAQGQVRVQSTSQRRLEELARVDVCALSAQQQARHEDLVQKHTAAVRECHRRNARSVVLTSPSAGYMQVPGDIWLPGHRATVVAAGASERLVVGVLVNAAGSDQGQLGPALEEARRVLLAAGVPGHLRLQAAADSGYWCAQDLAFCVQNAGWVQVLVKAMGEKGPLANHPELFQRQDFPLHPDERRVVCPAGRPMRGSAKAQADGTWRYAGEGCDDCPLRPRCTEGRQRTMYVDWDFERGKQAMLQRLAQPDAPVRYNQRMATVEPVFSSVEDGMGYRRVSSRHPPTVLAEVVLKLLAHNVSRLLARSRLFCVFALLEGPAPLHA
ncbi:transposase [Pyxidicoccus sp. 3LG]